MTRPTSPTAALPAASAPPPAELPEKRRATGGVRSSDRFALLGAAAGAVSATAVLFSYVAPFSGLLGFIAVAYGLFVLLYALLVSFDERGPVVRDRLASVVVHSAGMAMLTLLLVVIGYTFWRGREALPHGNFFRQDMADAGPLEPLTVGGITHAIAGTLIQISIALAVVVPLGLVCAVFLYETRGSFARFVRTVVEAMTALPSIIAGLFIYATLILSLGLEKSGLAAGLALSVEMLPITIRAADVVLRLVPGSLKEASYALGTSSWRTVWHVVLPTARSGLTTAVILGTARGIGEAAPVLITAGFTTRMNLDPLHGPMNSLPLATLYFVKSPQASMISRGFGTAALLMLLVLVLFTIARIIGGRGPGQLSRRQLARARRESERDLRRFDAGSTRGPAPVGASSPASPSGRGL